MRDLYAQLSSTAHTGAFGKNGSPEPSLANLKAGNYKKGRFLLHGLSIAIETPQGHRRTGKSNGEPWSVICQAHYGYLVGSKASDGDAIDVYVGPAPESQKVFVVNQNNAAGAFDEVKVMLGFLDEQSARTAYMNSYERGWNGLGSMIAATIDQFRWWVKFGNTTLPFSTRALPYDGNDEMNQTVWDSAANPVGIELADVIYRLRKDDGDGLLLDAVTASDILKDSDGEQVLDALVVEYAKLDRKAAQLNKVMEANSGTVKPVSVQVTPPFKQKGTTNVVILFELSDGQTVSIFMHNPDSTPNKILPADELVSWKWLLNKKDITVVVAPEKGQDLNPREVARRIMRLAEKNSARFAQANKGRSDRMAAIEQLKGDVSGKEATLQALDEQFRDLSDKVEAKRNAPAPASLQTNDQPDPTEPGQVTAVDPADPAIAAVTQTNDQPDQPVSTGDTLVAATVEPEPAVVQGQAAAVTIEQVADIMKRWNSDVLYAQVDANAEAARIMAAAQANGWISRRSTTQVDWTEAGSDQLKAARAAEPAPIIDPLADVDAALTGLGFKRVQGNDWASPAFPQEGGSTKGFNVRASGDPTQYRLSFRVTFPGITGASQDIGAYGSLDELLSAVTTAIAETSGTQDSPDGATITEGADIDVPPPIENVGAATDDILQARWLYLQTLFGPRGAATASEADESMDISEEQRRRRMGEPDWMQKGEDRWFENRGKAEAALSAGDYSPQGGYFGADGKRGAYIEQGSTGEGGEWVRFTEFPADVENNIVKVAELAGKTERETRNIYRDTIKSKGVDEANRLLASSIAIRQPTGGDDTSLADAKAFLQDVIDGNVDYMDSELATRLEEIHGQHVDNEDVMALFNDAAQAYSDYMVEQARSALA